MPASELRTLPALFSFTLIVLGSPYSYINNILSSLVPSHLFLIELNRKQKPVKPLKSNRLLSVSLINSDSLGRNTAVQVELFVIVSNFTSLFPSQHCQSILSSVCSSPAANHLFGGTVSLSTWLFSLLNTNPDPNCTPELIFLRFPCTVINFSI